MEGNGPVDGEVTRVEHYGLYVKTPEGDAVVLIPDVSKEPIPDLKAAYSPGDQVRVRLLRFVEQRGIHKATMILDA
ncbi:MAG: S1 RNA-binding domain-containing protein [Myxococcota bacterium]